MKSKAYESFRWLTIGLIWLLHQLIVYRALITFLVALYIPVFR